MVLTEKRNAGNIWINLRINACGRNSVVAVAARVSACVWCFGLATGDPPAWYRYPVAGADRPNAVSPLQAKTAFRAGTAFAWGKAVVLPCARLG